MKNNVSIAEERQFVTKEFVDTTAGKTPPPYLRLHDPVQKALTEFAASESGAASAAFNSLSPNEHSPNRTRGDRRTPMTKSNETSRPVAALKIKDAAQYLGGISHITVRRLIKRGLLKPNRALRHILIPIGELDRFLAEGQQ
jgi:Helix-turn-helix domain